MKTILCIAWVIAMLYFSWHHKAEIVIAINSIVITGLLISRHCKKNKRNSEF